MGFDTCAEWLMDLFPQKGHDILEGWQYRCFLCFFFPLLSVRPNAKNIKNTTSRPPNHTK
jgi:hypothetical protein